MAHAAPESVFSEGSSRVSKLIQEIIEESQGLRRPKPKPSKKDYCRENVLNIRKLQAEKEKERERERKAKERQELAREKLRSMHITERDGPSTSSDRWPSHGTKILNPLLLEYMPSSIAAKIKATKKGSKEECYIVSDEEREHILYILNLNKRRTLMKFGQFNDTYVLEPTPEMEEEADKMVEIILAIEEGVKIFSHSNVSVASTHSGAIQFTYGRRNSKSSKDAKILPSSVTPHPLGFLPSYVIEWKKREKIAKENEAKGITEPTGVLLSEEKRLETLDLLVESKEEILKSLVQLDRFRETTSIQREKADLEAKLARVEEGLKIFSRPKVYVDSDS